MRISVPLRPTAKNEGQALVGNENSLHGAYSSLSLGEQVAIVFNLHHLDADGAVFAAALFFGVKVPT